MAETKNVMVYKLQHTAIILVDMVWSNFILTPIDIPLPGKDSKCVVTEFHGPGISVQQQ
jgi:hypothetical protein